ncbi:MAG: AI-2E family transporter [Candidatus Saccharibacteria bacterium]|nr:AI-2E family transporter [Candidatus Saccharibacteria bacterium]MCY4089112.1 AI-2E family transporter [Candidatus Saccharibacteria bacterium]
MFRLTPSSDKDKLNLDIKFLTVVKVTAIVLLLILGIEFLKEVMPIILLLLLALLFAIALNPVVARVRHWFNIKSKTVATCITFGFVLIILIGFGAIIIPTILEQINDFAGNLVTIVERLHQQDDWLSNLLVSTGIDDVINTYATNISDFLTNNIRGVLGILQDIFSFFGSLFLVFVMAFMILTESPKVFRSIKTFIPSNKFQRWHELYVQMSEVVSGYISGQFIIALLGGLMSLVILLLLPLPAEYSEIAMAAIITVFSLVPLIGIIIGAGIVVLLTLLVDVKSGIILLIYFVVYQQIENLTIQPLIQGHQSNLSALQVLLATLIGASIAGIPGVLLSVPIAACIKVWSVDYFDRNRADLTESYKRYDQKRLAKKSK